MVIDEISMSDHRMRTYLVLDQKLDTLNWSSGSLRDGSGNTTHCRALLVPYP